MNKPAKIEKQDLANMDEVRLMNLPRADMKKFLAAEYLRLLQLNDQKIPEEFHIHLIVNELYKYLEEDWPGATFFSIRKSFMLGMNSQTGQRVWVNYPTLVYWLTHHRYAREKPMKGSADENQKEPLHVQGMHIILAMKERGYLKDLEFPPESPDPE